MTGTQANENQYKYVREKNRDPFPMKYTLRRQERLDLVEQVGVHGLVLFEYYLRMAAIENVELTDEAAAAYFGWTVHTAARHRRALVKKGWLKIERITLGGNRRFFVYYLGKDEVRPTRTIKG